jgi:type I restriction enzyme S subunit
MSNIVPEGWGYKCLSDIAKVDGDNLKNSTAPDYIFKYIDIASVSTGQINIPSETVEFENSPSRARKRIKKGDVLMATVRPNLKAFASFDEEGNDYIASTGFAVVRAKNGNSGRFILNTILSDDITRQIDALVVGSNYPAINSSDVKNLEILTPPFPEQQKIAKILTSVDNVIEKTQAQIDKLKNLKKGMMQELLTNGIGHTEFKDSPVGRIPAEWEVKLLGDMCEFTQGVQIPSSNMIRESKDGYIRYMYIRDFSSDDKQWFIEDIYPHKIITESDIAMANTGHTSGTVYKGKRGVLSNNAFKISFSPEIILTDFIYYFLQSGFFLRKIQQLFNTAGQPHVGHGNIAKMPMPLPPIDEQIKIAGAITKVTENETRKVEKLEHLQLLKKALMQDLLTGKVRVKTEKTNTEVAVG